MGRYTGMTAEQLAHAGVTDADLEAEGFTIDRHCYPPLAYKGPRFDTTEFLFIPVVGTLGIDELLAERESHRRTMTRSWLLLVATVLIAGLFFGFMWGKATTNCGEVYNPDGTHQHQCWTVHPTEDAP